MRNAIESISYQSLQAVIHCHKMSVVICPGIHASQLTTDFLHGLRTAKYPNLGENWLILPTQTYPPYSPYHIYPWLHQQESLKQTLPLVFICFSAGVVGGIGAALAWQMGGGKVKALLAFDGWGVPLIGKFPLHRFSHDYFTHWSSALIGAGGSSFYAEPEVDHLDLWRSPQSIKGWWVKRPGLKISCSAADLILTLLQQYGEI